MWIGALVGCGELVGGGESTADTGTSTGEQTCESCADLTEHGWCGATSTCGPIDGSACAWGLATYDVECAQPQRFVETRLAVDCRHPRDVDALECQRIQDLPAGSRGSGPLLDGYYVGGGFVEPDRAVLAVACDLCANEDAQTGIIAYDLQTGDRTLLSGRFLDPLQGIVEVGSGPVPRTLADVAVAPDGSWVALDSTVFGAEIYRIDPATGDRELLYDQASLDGGMRPICAVDGVGLHVGWEYPVLPQDGHANLVVGRDGALYLRGERAGDGSNDYGLHAIVALRDGRCDVVTAYSDESPTQFGVGSGAPLGSYFPWLVLDGDRLLAAPLSQFIRPALIAVDLGTGARSLLSSSVNDALVGDGPDVGEDFAVSYDDGRLMTNGAWTEFDVVLVDPATGDREGLDVLAGPMTFADNGPMLRHPSLPGVYLSMYEGITLFEPATGNSNVLSR